MIIEDLLKQMKLDYIETIPDKCQRITLLLKNDQRSDLETEFHKMKGTGKTYGLAEVSLLGEVIEKILMSLSLPLNDSIPVALKLLQEIYESRKADKAFMIEDSHDFQILKVKVRKTP